MYLLGLPVFWMPVVKFKEKRVLIGILVEFFLVPGELVVAIMRVNTLCAENCWFFAPLADHAVLGTYWVTALCAVYYDVCWVISVAAEGAEFCGPVFDIL